MSSFDDFLNYAINDTVNNGDAACGRCGHGRDQHAITNGKPRCWARRWNRSNWPDYCDCEGWA